MIENKNIQNRCNNVYDDGNIPEIDRPTSKNEVDTKNKKDQNSNRMPEIELPGKMRATDIIPDEVPGRSGPGGE